jgi:hypothetical protein
MLVSSEAAVRNIIRAGRSPHFCANMETSPRAAAKHSAFGIPPTSSGGGGSGVGTAGMKRSLSQVALVEVPSSGVGNTTSSAAKLPPRAIDTIQQCSGGLQTSEAIEKIIADACG